MGEAISMDRVKGNLGAKAKVCAECLLSGEIQSSLDLNQGEIFVGVGNSTFFFLIYSNH